MTFWRGFSISIPFPILASLFYFGYVLAGISCRGEMVISQIKQGQPKNEVEAIIGSPTEVIGADPEVYWIYYTSDSEIYVLCFKENKLVETQKVRAMNGRKAKENEPNL
jgi:hypothetical protein